MKCRYLRKADGERCGIGNFPNFHRSGNIAGMKREFYGKGALLVRCGSWIYNVTEAPYIYWNLAH